MPNRYRESWEKYAATIGSGQAQAPRQSGASYGRETHLALLEERTGGAIQPGALAGAASTADRSDEAGVSDPQYVDDVTE